MDTKINLDNIDLTLLQILQENSRFTNKELAAAVNLSPTPVYERVKRLETLGYIKKYVAVLDAKKLNLGFEAYCNVRLSRQNASSAEDFLAIINELPEVTECYCIAGSYDYLLKIHASDMDHYRRIVVDTLGKIGLITQLESTFVMSVEKRTVDLPLSPRRAKGIKLKE